MKKITVKSMAASFILMISLSFTGCFSPIFFEINNDVAPEKATVTGNILSVARYTVNEQEFLVTISKGGIKYKPVDIKSEKYSKHGCWNDFDSSKLPFNPLKYDYYGEENFIGQQMIKIVSDSSNLYLVTAEYTNKSENGTSIPSKTHLYTTSIKSFSEEKDNEGKTTTLLWNDDVQWNEIKLEDGEKELLPIFVYEKNAYSAFNVFSTNSVQNAHRKAFVRCGGSAVIESISKGKRTDEMNRLSAENAVYYELSEAGITKLDKEKTVNFDDSPELNYGLNSAVWFNGEIKFFNSLASETNETFEKDATMIYYGNGNKVFYSDGTKKEKALETSKSGNVSVSCLAVCEDSLLIGQASYSVNTVSGTGGIAKTTLDKGIPGKELQSFDSNAQIKLKSSYYILTLLNEDPSKKESESNIFSSITFVGSGTSSSATFENVGLWSYYPTRKNWNKE